MSDEVQVIRVAPTGKCGGRWVMMGDFEFRIPPLSFGQLEDSEGTIAEIQADYADRVRTGSGTLPSRMTRDKIRSIVLMALQRNYPEMTIERLRDLLDLGNMAEVFGAVMAVSGLRRADRAAEAPTEGGA